jgi:hypothetical protein
MNRLSGSSLSALGLLNISILVLLCVLTPHTDTVCAQSFDELKASEVYRKLELGEGLSRSNINRDKNRRSSASLKDYTSNYESLWATPQGFRFLVQWLELHLPRYKLSIFASGTKNDHGSVEAILQNEQRIKVMVTIQVPKPTYKTMAQNRTLQSFNRFRPPLLEVVGGQTLEMHGVQVDYYRHTSGACSLVIPTDQEGLINLMVKSCIESEAMFDVARLINLERLNQKLNS